MSDFSARKIKTFFKHFNVKNDGNVSLKDFVELAERLSDFTKASAVQREEIKAIFVKVWRQWTKSSGSDDSGFMTASIFAESVKQQRNDPEFKEGFLELCHQFFALIDVNGDGFLQEEEYAKSYAYIGFQDTGFVRSVFEIIDLNGDGKLSWHEYSTALVDYLTSEDENSPYVMLWGPLAD